MKFPVCDKLLNSRLFVARAQNSVKITTFAYKY